MKFIFSEDVKRIGVRGAYFCIRGLENKPSEYAAAACDDLLHLEKDDDYMQVLPGFKQLHQNAHIDGEKYTASGQALRSYYNQHNKLPQINGLVDIYNTLSFQSGLAMGAHDMDKINGDVHLKLTSGNELYWPIGSNKKQKISANEYAYMDDTPEIICRLEVRQVEKTKVILDSKNIFFIVQGHKWTEESYIQNHAQKLHDIAIKIFGGKSEWY